jgi:hypothetical protein
MLDLVNSFLWTRNLKTYISQIFIHIQSNIDAPLHMCHYTLRAPPKPSRGLRPSPKAYLSYQHIEREIYLLEPICA